MEFLEKLSLAGLVPVIAVNDADDAVPLCKALSDGGLPVAEITFRTAAAEEAIRRVHEAMPDVLLCAGTVLTTEQVDRAVNAGAAAIVSPGLSPDVVKYCVERGIPVCPGTANPSDVQIAIQYGLKAESQGDVEDGALNIENYKAIASLAMQTYPNIKRVAITLRESKSANHNDWSACLYNGKDFFLSRKYAITDIVDRVGGGDSFGGGLIYGLNTYADEKTALEFAVAASCLKHTILGDYNRVSVSEVESLMKGSGTGRVQR